MKVLFDHPAPFALAHGGFQIQIEQTREALIRRGVGVEWTRWWDENQSGDIIHYFGRADPGYIDFAHSKGRKVVMGELLTGLGSRSAKTRFVQKAIIVATKRLMPESFWGKLGWDSYRRADAFIALTRWEAYLMQSMFDANPAKVHVIPNGVEAPFLAAPEGAPQRPRQDYLICTAAIHPRKQVVELAEAAIAAQVPVWIVGRPYDESEAYYQRLLEVRKQNPEYVRYEGGISDRAQLAQAYREARGFVLLSTMESLSLSALEAAACGLPLLVPNLPWAREYFADQATYFDIHHIAGNHPQLRAFYEKCPLLGPPVIKVYSWDEIADQLIACYQSLLANNSPAKRDR